jgi:hypothetical protein
MEKLKRKSQKYPKHKKKMRTKYEKIKNKIMDPRMRLKRN